jgi:ketosteroid isomerase-like protein
MLLLPAAAVLFLLCSCAPAESGYGTPDPEVSTPTEAMSAEGQVSPADVEDLLEADREFDRVTTEKGLDGWMSYFAEDAVRLDLHGEVVRDLDAIRAKDTAMFADPQIRLTWSPTDGGLFRDGRHGFTRGRYRVVRQDEEDLVVISRGAYLSIWRRENGEWKVILDTGAADATGEETVDVRDEEGEPGSGEE